MSLNPNSVIDVRFEETDGDEVLRRFFLYPGPHDKITDCLLSCWSADACHLKALFAVALSVLGRIFIFAPGFADIEIT